MYHALSSRKGVAPKNRLRLCARRRRRRQSCHSASAKPPAEDGDWPAGRRAYFSCMRYLITGATGFVGGHLAEACIHRQQTSAPSCGPRASRGAGEAGGDPLSRRTERSRHLVRQAVTEADVVIHCAAKVGDWGPVEEYRQVNVDGLRSCSKLARDRLSRFILMSSLGVYAARHHHGTTEDRPRCRIGIATAIRNPRSKRSNWRCTTTRNSACRW